MTDKIKFPIPSSPNFKTPKWDVIPTILKSGERMFVIKAEVKLTIPFAVIYETIPVKTSIFLFQVIFQSGHLILDDND